MAGKILTREEYADALVRLMPQALRQAAQMLDAVEYPEIIDRCLNKWDRVAVTLGDCDLTSRDQLAEAADEVTDLPGWLIIGLVRRERGL